MRRENLTVDESAEAMGAIMSGEATPAQVGALLVGLTMKGERPAEIVGLARTMRANAVQLSARRSTTCSTRAAPAAIGQARSISRRRRRSWSRGRRAARGEARQSVGVEPVRQRRRVRGAGREHRRAIPRSSSGRSTRWASRSSSRRRSIPSMRHAAPVRRELGVRTAFNLLGPLDQSRGHTTAARGRAALGADGAHRARAAVARLRRARGSCTAPTASTRCRRPGTRRCPSAGTARSRRSTCTRRISGFPKADRQRPAGWRCGGQRRDRARRFSPARKGRGGTSCC